MPSMRKAGRPERPVDPGTGPEKELAFALRELREKNGSPSYRAMATHAHYSASTLARAASGASLPSRDLLLAYVRACGGVEEEWARRLDAATAQLNQEAAQLNQEKTPVHESGGRSRRARARILVVALATTAAAGGITAATIMTNGHPTAAPGPSGTPVVYHDGDDPIVTGCSQDVQTIDEVPLYTTPGKRFGTLLLRHSPSCAMNWGTVLGPDPHLYRVHIIARRPADGAQAPSSWAQNTPDSYGNMLSTFRSCVLAEAYVQTPAGSGPQAQTRCLR